MLRVLLFLLITVCFCVIGCKKKPAAEPAKATSVKKEIQTSEVTKENMQDELDDLEKQIDEETVE